MNDALEWFQQHAGEYAGLGGGELHFSEPMSRHAYYRIGGPAAIFASPQSREQLNWLIAGLKQTKVPHFLLGGGSNLLVSDDGFQGLVIQTAKLNAEVSIVSRQAQGVALRTGASVTVGGIIRRAMQEGWAGLEFLCGIPGTLGGAVFMNAGTQLGEAKDHVKEVEVILLAGEASGQSRVFRGPELRFEYRKNLFLPESALIWSMTWNVTLQPAEQVRQILTESLNRRKETQPLNFPSCGSVFKNPEGTPLKAWQVIQQVGLKGHRVGNAQFSVKHSNFIVNLGEARAADVLELIRLAQERAKIQLGIELEPEVKLVGQFPGVTRPA